MGVLGTPPDDFMSKISSESVSIRESGGRLRYSFKQKPLHVTKSQANSKLSLTKLKSTYRSIDLDHLLRILVLCGTPNSEVFNQITSEEVSGRFALES